MSCKSSEPIIGQVVSSQHSVVSRNSATNDPRLTTENWQLTTRLVGRESELAQLHHWLNNAITGERQLVFVSGEPGIGKTALVETFLQQVATRGGIWVSAGQCVEHYGPGATYLPILDALNRFCREAGHALLPELLQRYAPTWRRELPWFLNEAERAEPRHSARSGTPQRMLREFAEFTEAVTAERPLVLVVEDLQWSDTATVDLLGYLARRRESARFLIIGTYRPGDLLTGEHPLQFLLQELQTHGYCRELPLSLLSTDAVRDYVARQLPDIATNTQLLHELAHRVHERTEGNALFMVTVVEDLVTQSRDAPNGNSTALFETVLTHAPASVQTMIQQQAARLSKEEQELLEAASVAGAEFSAAEAAAGLDAEVTEVERIATLLARKQQFLRFHGVSDWPDGTIAGRYRFLHVLHQQVLYERVPPARRVQLHNRIGARLEAAYGQDTGEVAAALAAHFVRGRDPVKAVAYLTQAANTATRRFGYQEAISQLTQALRILRTLPETTERDQQELFLQLTLLGPLIALKGYGAAARRQGAKWLELYATKTLSRLWLRQGKKVQARQLLAELHAWFTEGFDTVDLQEVKTLLEAIEV